MSKCNLKQNKMRNFKLLCDHGIYKKHIFKKQTKKINKN